MKKFTLFLTLGLVNIGLLSGCTSKKVVARYHIEYSETDAPSSLLVPIDNDGLVAAMDGQVDMLLYMGSSYCSYCLETTPVFEEYIKKNNVLIYYYNTAVNNVAEGNANFPYLFNGTPALYVIDNGRIEESYLGKSKLDTLKKIDLIINRHTYDTPFNYVISKERINEIINEDETLIFVDRLNLNHTTTLSSKLEESLQISKKTLHFMDMSFFDDASINPLVEPFTLTKENISAAKFKNKNIESSKIYTDETLDEFVNFILG